MTGQIICKYLWIGHVNSKILDLCGLVMQIQRYEMYVKYILGKSVSNIIRKRSAYQLNRFIRTVEEVLIMRLMLFEPPRGKTNNLHRRKQRRRSASSSSLIQNFMLLASVVPINRNNR